MARSQQELDDLPRLIKILEQDRLDDIERGRANGIPECCIEFFVGPWANHDNCWLENLNMSMEDYSEWADSALGCQAGYVRCPQCIESGHAVTVHRCIRPGFRRYCIICGCGTNNHRLTRKMPPDIIKRPPHYRTFSDQDLCLLLLNEFSLNSEYTVPRWLLPVCLQLLKDNLICASDEHHDGYLLLTPTGLNILTASEPRNLPAAP